MLKVGLAVVIGVMLAVFAAVLAADLLRHREKVGEEPGNPLLLCLVAPVVMFFATMGISDFVMNTLFFKKCGPKPQYLTQKTGAWTSMRRFEVMDCGDRSSSCPRYRYRRPVAGCSASRGRS